MFDGFADSFAVFRVPDAANFLVSSASILVGTGGVGLNNVFFYPDTPDNDAHFAPGNSVVNGVACRTVGYLGGEIDFRSARACPQLIADRINPGDVRLNRCAPGQVPEPSVEWLAAPALAGPGLARRRARR